MVAITLCTDGISLLIKLLQLEDADVQAAAIHALSVVTASNDRNCRCVLDCAISCIYFVSFSFILYIIGLC